MSRVAWYYAERGETHGPVTWDGLLAAVQDGRLSSTGSVWSPGVDDWVASNAVPWLFRMGGATAPLPLGAGTTPAGDVTASQPVVTNPPPIRTGRVWTRKGRVARSPLTRFGFQRAMTWRRAVAAIADLIGASVIGFVIAAIVVALERKRGGPAGSDGLFAIGFGIWAATLLLYHVAQESMSGTTVGKRLMQVQLVDANGEPPFATRIVARVVLRFVAVYWVLFSGLSVALYLTGSRADVRIVPFMLAVSAMLLVPLFLGERRPLHDLLTGCWLVRAPTASTPTGATRPP